MDLLRRLNPGVRGLARLRRWLLLRRLNPGVCGLARLLRAPRAAALTAKLRPHLPPSPG